MSRQLRRSIQQVLLASTAVAFTAGVFAAVGVQDPPPGPGQVPDYFGITPNYTNSPQPILVLVSGGTGTGAAATTYDYTNDAPTKNIMDVQGGTGYVVGDTLTLTGGATSCTVTVNNVLSPSGKIAPNIDAITGVTTPGVTIAAGTCTGFTTPIAGSGIRKFIDSLSTINTPNNLGEQIPVAVPDTTTFPGSDYYEIALTTYSQKLNTDLPATPLRGYRQINVAGSKAASKNNYLGPMIIAQKDRPVRVKLVNQLPTGAAGNLPIPVDTTYMGSDGPTDTHNRHSMHFHGGNTPWISDGTPRQWVKPKGEVGPNKGESVRYVPDMWFDAAGKVVASGDARLANPTANGLSNNPGDGSITFFFTNEQSARLMWYHDHSEGTTRLNVYSGIVAPYILQDPTEQALVNNGTIPSLADTIPLIIQEKTFVPDNKYPVMNFYGPFASALNSSDPTWRWGTNSPASTYNGNGDLWVPHVFMTNQNPGTVTGANNLGRWDYGPWFWPPFANLTNNAMPNPYYDPLCDTTINYCEPSQMPGVPNGALKSVLSNGVAGGVMDNQTGLVTESPTGTPEAFNDTPLVNGTAYPYINVDPKKYRLRILSAADDRMLNLSLLVAASKNSVDTTAAGNAGTQDNTILCDGTTGVNPADCTEVKMVPFNTIQDAITHFPAWWYSKQKAGTTFDGRPAGVFDPATRGPEMVQIGTDGGFISTPVEIKNQPVNYEYNPKNILIGNVKEHALLLGPAERADVVVDFSSFAGSTLILFNDAPAPMPAWDLRLDYLTGGYDTTDTGGAFSVVPGYGPNTRTLMQIRVAATCTTPTCGVAPLNRTPNASRPVDDVDATHLATITTAVQTAFRTSQEPIIVPQSVYSQTYGIGFLDALGADLSRISDNWLTYNPITAILDPITGKATGDFSLVPTPVTLNFEPKSIIEDWTTNWGRMNALLGVEIPRTTASTQTSIPMAYVDPPTEVVKITPNDNMVPISGTAPDGTQLWKVTHNGVDSHSVHFHLFHVQLVNRVGWDGAVYPPEANELGWKDTVRMNPLSDTIVALRPMEMTKLPFKVPNSHRLLDPQQPLNAPSMGYSFDPLTNLAVSNLNQSINLGWEYIWHCHILGHEENDMMRVIAVAKPPEAPINLTATTVPTGVTLNWTDNSIIANWVQIQRSTSPTFATIDANYNVLTPECTSQTGCARTFTDTKVGALASVYYRIESNNTVGGGDGQLDVPRLVDGTYGSNLPTELASLTPGYSGYANVTANSNWTTVSRLFQPFAVLTPSSYTFPNTLVGNTAPLFTAKLSNTGTGLLNISSITLPTGAFTKAAGGTCGTTLVAGASCSIVVQFKPTATSVGTATLTVTDNSQNVANSTQTVLLTGTGIQLNGIASVTPSSITFPVTTVGTTSPVQLVNVSNTGPGTLTISGTTASASFATTRTGVARPCGATVAAGVSCNIGVVFAPTSVPAVSGTLVIADNSNGVPSTQTVTLSGTTPIAIANVVPTSLTFPSTVVGGNSATQIVAVSNTGTGPLAISGITVAAPFVRVNNAITASCGTTLAAGATCNIGVRFSPVVSGVASGNLVIADNSGGTATTQTVSLTGSTPLPGASLSATSLTFPSTALSVASATQTVVLTNTGGSALAIGGITVSAPFTRVTAGLTNSCGTTLAAGTTCNIAVGYTPTAVGAATGTLTVTDNAGGIANTVQSVALQGVGVFAVTNDLATATATTITNQTVTVAVRTNDIPTTGTVAIVSSSFTNGGATATASVANNEVVWTLTGTGVGGATRQALKRGTYTVVYSYTVGTTTAQATAILMVN